MSAGLDLYGLDCRDFHGTFVKLFHMERVSSAGFSAGDLERHGMSRVIALDLITARRCDVLPGDRDLLSGRGTPGAVYGIGVGWRYACHDEQDSENGDDVVRLNDHATTVSAATHNAKSQYQYETAIVP